jgi:hypothetical protein
MQYRTICILALTGALGGCATGIRVDYVSDPGAAVVYEAGAPKGVTPVSLFYEPDATFKAGGCMNTRPMSVKWASGATASISHLQLCASQGMVQNYVFQRPDMPGREIDANYALQVERNQIMRAQAAAQIMQATTPPPAPVYQVVQPPAPPRPVNCTSQRIGGQVQTTCY